MTMNITAIGRIQHESSYLRNRLHQRVVPGKRFHICTLKLLSVCGTVLHKSLWTQRSTAFKLRNTSANASHLFNLYVLLLSL